MISYFDAEQKVLKKMSANPTIPQEAFQSLVEEEFFGKKKEIKLNPVYPKVSDKPDMNFDHLGTEPEDWDLINESLCGEVEDEL